jgi:nucleotide-binding universal stress UspA family protein
MISNIVVAVDDSPGGMAAAGLAVELAAATKATLHAIAVVRDGVVAELLSTSRPGLRPASADAVLRHVTELARRASVPVEASQADGEVAPVVLARATSSEASLVVMGRTREPHEGQAVVGSQTSLVLEFATVPVVVVPPG